MAITQTQRAPASHTSRRDGFTLIIAVIFMSVLLSLGLALASLGYKQELLAASALESQTAFYAADAGLECALRADQQDDLFEYPSSPPDSGIPVPCANTAYTATPACYNGTTLNGSGIKCTTGQWALVINQPGISLALPDGTEKGCAEVTIYKPASTGTSYLFSQGYDIGCEQLPSEGGSAVRYVARGLSATY